LVKAFEYSEYRHFLSVVAKARETCKLSGYALEDHIGDVLDIVDIGSAARRGVAMLHSTRELARA